MESDKIQFFFSFWIKNKDILMLIKVQENDESSLSQNTKIDQSKTRLL